MIEHRGTIFSRARLAVDNQHFENCTFDACSLVFGATGPCQFERCTFKDSSFAFEGSAAATVKFLTELYKLAPQVVEETFDRIRLGM